jgi:hypothetical protein
MVLAHKEKKQNKKGKEIMADFGFTIEDTEKEAQGYRGVFEVIPPGWYPVVIVHSELKNTSSGGKMVVFRYRFEDGSDRELIDRLNTVNASEKAQGIGRAALAKIAESIGHKGALNSSDPLHGRPFDVKVVIEEFASNKTGEMLKSNKVIDYRPVTTKVAAPQTQESAKPW